MAKNGSAVLIAVNVGTTESPDYEVLPCQTSAEYTLSTDTIDTKCKDGSDATNLPGRRERSMSVESRPDDWIDIETSPTAAETVLRKAAETGLQITGAIVVSATEVETFTATISSFGVSAPDEEALTLSIELAISGAMTPVTVS